MKTTILAALLFASASQATLAATGPAASEAALTMKQARATALAAQPGTITDAELEREAGGSGLRYSFDIKSGGRMFEVGVDAKTGAILERKREGAHPD